MQNEILSLSNIVTREISIINRIPVDQSDEVQIELNRKTKKDGTHFWCLLTAVVYRSSEKDESNKSFHLRFSMEGSFDCLPDSDKKDLASSAVKMMFPFVRATIASVLSSAFIDAIILPPFIMNE